MRRTGTRVRGWRFAASAVVAGLAVGVAAPSAVAVDSIRAMEWHLDQMHASEMWQTSTGAGVTVAVIDSGVDGSAPDLQGQLLPGLDFSGLSGGATVDEDPDGHGTSIAALIAGTGKGLGGKGAYGLAPGVKILPVKINAGSRTTSVPPDYVDQMSQAIIAAADHGAKVINLSQGSSSPGSDKLAMLKSAVDHAISRGSLVVAAVGNSGDKGNPVDYPAALPGVVGVAALDQQGKVTAESEHGPQVALSAPGWEMYTACTGTTGYCDNHGTSDATALTSASAALVWAVHPDWTAHQVLRVLINTAGKPQDGSNRSDFVGYGVVRPRVALTNPGDPGPADASPLGVAAPTGGASTPSGTASAPAASVPSGSVAPTAGAVPGAASAKKGSGGGTGLILGGVVVVLLLLAVGVVLVVRHSRRDRSPFPTAPVVSMPPIPRMPPVPPMAPMPGGYPGQQPPQPGWYPPPPGWFPQQPQGPQPPPQGQNPPPQGQNPPPPYGGGPYGQ